MSQGNLNLWESKESKDNYQAVQTDKNEWLQFYLYTLANNNLKRNLKKQFPFNNVNINKILCHWGKEDDKTGTLEILHDADTCPRHMHTYPIATERLRMAIARNASSIWNEDSIWITEDWKVVAEPRKAPGFLASRGEEFNPGPVDEACSLRAFVS